MVLIIYTSLSDLQILSPSLSVVAGVVLGLSQVPKCERAHISIVNWHCI